MGMGPETLSQDEIDRLLSSLGGSADVGEITPSLAPPGGSMPAPTSSLDGLPNILGNSEHFGQDEKRAYKTYNFRRPDKFSKDHLRAMQTIHESFARQLAMILTAYLRMNIDIDVVSVDQMTYEEFIRSMPSPITVAITEMSPLPGQALLGLTYEIVSSLIDRMLGGPGLPDSRSRALTDIEQNMIRRIINKTLNTLEDAWQSFVPVETSIVGMEESYALIQVASPGEMVALITFEVVISSKDSGLMSLCLPYPILENVLDKLSSQHIFHSKHVTSDPMQRDTILEKLHYAKTPVQVYLGGTNLSIQELLELSVGDVVRLERQANEELLVNVNEKPKFYGRAGRMKNKLAICITDSVDNVEQLNGFGI